MGTIAISGSASGIGAATRQLVEEAGHEVIGIDLRGAELTADLSTVEGRTATVDGVLAACGGRLDGLVTAAGVGPPFDPQAMCSINYFGTAALLTGLRDALAASGDAQVVAISSNSTTTGPDIPADLVDACLGDDEAAAHAALSGVEDSVAAMSWAYAGSKLAVARFVRSNAPTAEWAGSGIRLNAIAPGATLTPLLQAGLDSEDFGPQIRDFPTPTGSFANPGQIAAWIEFMLLGEPARFLCGSVVFVDGGTDALVRARDWPATYSLGA